MKKLYLLSLVILLLQFSLSAQQSLQPEAERFYFECPNLDFDKYAALHEQVKADGRFQLETACIPAHIICVKPLNAGANGAAFKQLALLSGIPTVHHRNTFTRAEFDQRCAAARTGN